MQRITIEIAEDGATTMTVETDGQEPQVTQHASADEAIDALEDLVESSGSSAESMWAEEAAARPEQPGLMV